MVCLVDRHFDHCLFSLRPTEDLVDTAESQFLRSLDKCLTRKIKNSPDREVDER